MKRIGFALAFLGLFAILLVSQADPTAANNSAIRVAAANGTEADANVQALIANSYDKMTVARPQAFPLATMGAAPRRQ